ncbi:MAG: hypothetical protein IPJ41_18060 [Phycisphaerales bacterium]|nr:hypothetical protein [Phycisphaerales bacterium]
MKRFVLAVVFAAIASHSPADVLYLHTPYSPAGLAPSSWVEPDDSDSDQYTWDAFTLASGGTVTQVKWRGGYQLGAPYGHVTGFVIGFWPSNSYGGEPDVLAHPVEYSVRGLAGESYVGTFNGIAMYEYTMNISPGFVAEPGIKYWIQIEGSQTTYPDWGLAWGVGGDGSNFRYIRGYHMFFNYSHDTTFSLIGTSPCTGAGVVQDPVGVGTCAAGSAEFLASGSGTGPLAYQWERETSPGSNEFVALSDGSTGSWDGGGPGVGAIVLGSDTDTLTISADSGNGLRLAPVHAVRYRCTISNGCGSASSVGALLSVCFADFNCDGGVNTLDVLGFLNAWSTQAEAGDFNHDGAVNTLDVLAFLNAWSTGC